MIDTLAQYRHATEVRDAMDIAIEQLQRGNCMVFVNGSVTVVRGTSDLSPFEAIMLCRKGFVRLVPDDVAEAHLHSLADMAMAVWN